MFNLHYLFPRRGAMLLAALVLSAPIFAQSRIGGIVRDAQGQPLVGVTVIEAGTTNGTITDIDGSYSLDVAPGAKLVYSFIGYSVVEAEAAEGSVIVLKEDNKMLSEVVAVGYGTMRRKDVTSSISTIDSDELNKGVMTSPAQMLQGKVQGLVVSTSSNPTSSPSITLRGASTLRTGDAQQPLYVIDGVPGVDIALISPDDIETIDVLRDATATAIYGSKAANGVIMVTTKKGVKDGTSHVAYNGYVAAETVAKKLDMATASELRAYAKANNFELPSDEGADVDWQDEVERTALAHNHNLSIAGGTTKANFNISLGYLSREGVIDGTKLSRLTGRAYGQASALNDRLTVALGVNASRSESEEVPASTSGQSVTDAMLYYSPTQPVRDTDGEYFRSTTVSQYYNPVSMVNEDTEKTIDKQIQLTGKADLKIIDGFTWTANFSYLANQSTENVYHSTKSQIVNTNGQASRTSAQGDKKLFETYGNYQHEFNRRHRLGLMVGYSWEETRSNDSFGVTVKNFYNDAVKYYNLSYANSIDGMDAVSSGAESTLRLISLYGRLNYSFNSKYNLQATIRRDGSSAFGTNNRWATFPSVSAAWRISEEDFMKDGIFDDLKLRAGYGVSGNSLGFDAYTALQTYSVTGWFQYVDENGTSSNMHTIGASSNSNPDLKWERTGMFNLGLDFSILKGRLSGSIEYYDKQTHDLIYYYPVSTNRYPYGTMTANVGDISNRGIEVSVTGRPVMRHDFSWVSSLNLSHNKNTVESISNDTYSVNYIAQADPNIAGNTGVNIQRIMEGCPIGQFYTYEWAGYDENGVSQFYVHDPETGERTGETTTTPVETDQTKTGSAQPKLTFGWDNTLTFKNWSLNLFFQGVTGNKIFNALRAQYNSVNLISQGKNVLAEALTDQKYGDVNAQYPSDRYLENGSYLRLKTLTLSYNFGDLGAHIGGMTIYATCNNVFTITGYKGDDPEIDLGGLTPGIQWRDNYYPHTRTFLLGLNVNL